MIVFRASVVIGARSLQEVMDAAHIGFTEIDGTAIEVIAGIREPNAHTRPTSVVGGADFLIVARKRRERVIAPGTGDASFLRAWIVVVTVYRVSNADPSLTKLRVCAGVPVAACRQGRGVKAAHFRVAIGGSAWIVIFTWQLRSPALSVFAAVIFSA